MTTQTADTKQLITVEVYDKNAILTERIELPKNIRSLERIFYFVKRHLETTLDLESKIYINLGQMDPLSARLTFQNIQRVETVFGVWRCLLIMSF
jgi:hypothetical protein